MIEKRLEALEKSIIQLTVAVRALQESYLVMTNTNPDTSAFVPDIVKRARSRGQVRITRQNVIDAFDTYCKDHGNQAGKDILSVWGVESISELEPEQFPGFMEQLTSV